MFNAQPTGEKDNGYLLRPTSLSLSSPSLTTPLSLPLAGAFRVTGSMRVSSRAGGREGRRSGGVRGPPIWEEHKRKRVNLDPLVRPTLDSCQG